MTLDHWKARFAMALVLAGVLLAGPGFTLADSGTQSPAPEAPTAHDPTSRPEGGPPWGLHEDELGVRTGQPLDSGFVFYDWKYVEPPYVVSRKGMGVFINDKMVQPPFMKWPPPVEDPSLGTSDPPMPQGLARTTSPYDPAMLEYLGQKRAYLQKNLGHEEAIAAMGEAYRSLPCVEDARVDSVNPEIVVVRWRDGTSQNVQVFPPTGRRIRWDKPTLIEHLDEQRRFWEDRLGKGDVYFFWDGGGPYTGGPGFVESTFPKVLRILRSTDTEAQKIAALQRPEGGGVPPDTATRLARYFWAPPELEERLTRHIERFQRERAEKAQQPPSPPSSQPAPNGGPGA